MRIEIAIGLIFSLASCRDHNISRITSLNADYSNKKIETKTESLSINKSVGPPVDIKHLKKLDFIETTSGVVPRSESSTLYRPDTSGFFGLYILFNKAGYTLIGYLYIYSPDRPENWKYDNNNETFALIQLERGDIKIWDSIGVGTTEKELLDFIGQNFYYKKNTLLHAEIGSYSADFTILADTINQITIGKYR